MNLGELIERLKRAVDGLKGAYGDSIAGLLLFGSYARGEASGESDVDVLIVVRGLRGLKFRGDAYSILAEHVRRPLTLVDVDLNEVAKEDLEVTPLLLNALYDGIVIYDELGVLGELKSRVYELVEKAGMVRYRTPDGKYGWRRVDDKPLEVVEV